MSITTGRSEALDIDVILKNDEEVEEADEEDVGIKRDRSSPMVLKSFKPPSLLSCTSPDCVTDCVTDPDANPDANPDPDADSE